MTNTYLVNKIPLTSSMKSIDIESAQVHENGSNCISLDMIWWWSMIMISRKGEDHVAIGLTPSFTFDSAGLVSPASPVNFATVFIAVIHYVDKISLIHQHVVASNCFFELFHLFDVVKIICKNSWISSTIRGMIMITRQ